MKNINKNILRALTFFLCTCSFLNASQREDYEAALYYVSTAGVMIEDLDDKSLTYCLSHVGECVDFSKEICRYYEASIPHWNGAGYPNEANEARSRFHLCDELSQALYYQFTALNMMRDESLKIRNSLAAQASYSCSQIIAFVRELANYFAAIADHHARCDDEDIQAIGQMYRRIHNELLSDLSCEEGPFGIAPSELRELADDLDTLYRRVKYWVEL